MIDRKVFSRWMAVFGDRVGRQLEPETLTAYYAAMTEDLDSETFQRAALQVFKTHGYNSWPAAIDFVRAGVELRRVKDAEIRATQKLLAGYREQPPASDAMVEEFSRTWREVLADCDPARTRRWSPRTGDDGAWLTDETRPATPPAPDDDALRAAQNDDADREVA
jgi:hypothetical protein